jgi:hypothetical protein
MSIENSRLYIMTLYRWNYDRKGPKLLVQLVEVELLLDSCLNQFLSPDQKGRKINDNGCGDCIF